MRASRPALLLLLCLLLRTSASAQQIGTPIPSASTPSPLPQPNAQAATLIQSALTALTGGLTPSDVTITGTITLTKYGSLASTSSAAGQSTAESGSITLAATVLGQGRETIATAARTSTTIQDVSQEAPVLSVMGADGLSHTIQTASALTPHPAWFYPVFLLASGLSSSYAASYVGHETWQGVPVEHLAIWRVIASGATAALQIASQHDVYLDSTSLLPVGMTFIMHPYDSSDPSRPIIPYRGNSPDRLTTIQFSDYRSVQGRPVAFHVRAAMTVIPFDTTGDLISDIQVSSVSFNTGATITVPSGAPN